MKMASTYFGILFFLFILCFVCVWQILLRFGFSVIYHIYIFRSVVCIVTIILPMACFSGRHFFFLFFICAKIWLGVCAKTTAVSVLFSLVRFYYFSCPLFYFQIFLRFYIDFFLLYVCHTYICVCACIRFDFPTFHTVFCFSFIDLIFFLQCGQS